MCGKIIKSSNMRYESFNTKEKNMAANLDLTFKIYRREVHLDEYLSILQVDYVLNGKNFNRIPRQCV